MEGFAESVKEYITPSRFSLFGYLVGVIYFSLGSVIFARTVVLASIARQDFTCDVRDSLADKNFLQKKCFEVYKEEYNSPLPLVVFVFLNVFFTVVVCMVYSRSVKSRVADIEKAIIPNVEEPRRIPRRLTTTSRVFWCYLSQLMVRFVLGIFFVVLQTRVLYPSDYQPYTFRCVLPTATTNATIKVNNVTNNASVDCQSKETVWAMLIWVANIAHTVSIVVEGLYLIVKAFQFRRDFMADSEFCQKVFFKKSKTPITLYGFISNMKKRILEETEIVGPLISENAEDYTEETTFKKFFVDLMIHKGRAERNFENTMEEREIFAAYVKPPHDSTLTLKTLEELFLPTEDSPKEKNAEETPKKKDAEETPKKKDAEETPKKKDAEESPKKKDAVDPRKILIVGSAGIGKSSLCKKLLRDWACGHLLSADSPKNFEYAFLFQFRDFNSKETEKLSLKELLERSTYSEENIDEATLQHILENPEKILLVFDGLDEFKEAKNLLADEGPVAGNDPKEKMSTSELYKKLMKNKLLPGATVVTTSRPNVVQSVQAGLRLDRNVEILGFTEEKVQEYVKKFCGPKNCSVAKKKATTMWEHIKNNLKILSLCYIPMNCYVVCLVLKYSIDRGVITLPTTMSKLYEDVVRLFVFTRHPEYRCKPLTEDRLSCEFSEAVEKCLEELGALAKKGIEENRHLFEYNEVVTGLQDCGFLYRLKCSRISQSRVRLNFCFIHVTLQQFFAAREILKLDGYKLSKFISSKARDAKWHLVIQFVAGMLQEKNPRQKEKAVDTIVRLLRDSLENMKMEQALLMIKCLYEANNSDDVKWAASQLQPKLCLSRLNITPFECAALVYFCKQFEQLQILDLLDNSISDTGCEELAKLLQVGGPKRLVLAGKENSITDQGVRHLCEALTKKNCNLTDLDLSRTSIPDEGARLLSEAMKQEYCKLTKLNLSGTSITDQGVLHLSEALQQERCKVTDLNLSFTSIADQGARHLCKALTKKNCNLADLDLSRTSIPDEGARLLSEAMKQEYCKLTKLNLSGTSITDQGVLHLSEALQQERCKVTDLNLCSTSIADQGARHLCKALKCQHSKLLKLDLSKTLITNIGAKKLSKALKKEQCKLKELYLYETLITAPGASKLSKAQKRHSKLKMLGL